MPISNSHELIKRIVSALFTAEERRLEKVRADLIKSNKELYPDRPHDGFLYQGQVYDPVSLVPGKRARVSLHNSLIKDMDDYLKDLEQVWTDRHYISQMLFTMLHPCTDLQEVRDALPNCLTDTIPELKRLPRTRPEAYTIENNAMALRQYPKVLRRMEFYSTARLLY